MVSLVALLSLMELSVGWGRTGFFPGPVCWVLSACLGGVVVVLQSLLRLIARGLGVCLGHVVVVLSPWCRGRRWVSAAGSCPCGLSVLLSGREVVLVVGLFVACRRRRGSVVRSRLSGLCCGGSWWGVLLVPGD